MSVSLKANPDGTSAAIQVGGADKLTINSDGSLVAATNPATGTRSNALATMQKFADEFSSSLAASGYQKLPSGLIIQWGKVSFPDFTGTTLISVAFPITFPSAVLGIVDGLGLTGGFNTAAMISESSISTSGFSSVIAEWNAVAQTGGQYRWIAIGY